MALKYINWRLWLALYVFWVVIPLIQAASTWTHPPVECQSVLPKNYRCHWPDENFNCECTKGAVCHDEDHHCVCHAGLTGNLCEQPCAYERDTPNPACHKDCSNSQCELGITCEQLPSLCGCLPGYSGPDCNWCDPKAFPDQCGKCPTHICQNGGKCDILSTECVCPVGYEGPPDRNDCSYCDPSIHPNKCLEHCDYDCHQGICDTNKKMCNCPNKALQGYDCSLCIPDAAPDNCTMYCHGYCLEGGYCNITQKQCVCLPGLYGHFCEYCNQTDQPVKCKEYCKVDCKNGGVCSVQTGQCICAEGFYGDDCGLCHPSEHPKKCLNYCKYQCYHSDCIASSGLCQCAPGLIGEDCRMCDPKTHDQNCTTHCKHECQEGSSCDTLLGMCKCLPGWTGLACDEACSELTYGIDCLEQCDCGGGPCHAVTGACIIMEKPVTTPPIVISTIGKPISEKATTQVTTKLIYVLPGDFPDKSKGDVYVKPPADTSASAPDKGSSLIILLAIAAILLFMLIVVSVAIVLRKHHRKKQLDNDSMPEEVPLNNLVIPVPDPITNDDILPISADIPLVPCHTVTESVDGLYTTIEERSSRPNSLMITPNPRKSTNLDAEAQRLFCDESGRPFFLGKSPKNIQIQKNIFDEKEALTKDKLKRDNNEDVIEQLKKEAEKEEVKGHSKNQYEERGQGMGSRRGSNQGKQTDSGFCEDNLEGAVGGDLTPEGAPNPNYERLESGNESTSSESLNNGGSNTNKVPVYSEINFDTKSGDTLRTGQKGDYHHLNRLDTILDSDPEVTLIHPRYSKLNIPPKAPKGYSHLEHGPRRRNQPDKKLVEDGEYASLKRDKEDSEDEE